MDLPFLLLLLSSFYFCSPVALDDEGIKIDDADDEVEIVDIDAEVDVRVVEGRKITGNDCEYIKLCEVLNNTSCSNGKHIFSYPSLFIISNLSTTMKLRLILKCVWKFHLHGCLFLRFLYQLKEHKLFSNSCAVNTSLFPGDKFVIRKMRGTRRQFLILNGRPVMGFRQRKKKFSSCPSFTQITATLQCKAGFSDIAKLSSSPVQSN